MELRSDLPTLNEPFCLTYGENVTLKTQRVKKIKITKGTNVQHVFA